jgi:diguanylate cyclase (GGDEF)-like protein
MSEELVRTNAQLTLLAASDALTGLPNRRTLDTQFASEWKRALRTETSLALLMVDIDHFKEFNDAYGHHAGDVCLQAVARALKASVQRSQDLVARFGGEEFAVLLPQTELSQAYHLAEKLRSAIHGLAIRHNRSATGSITISIGCAAATPSADTESVQLLRAADSALYTAKQMGRNRIQIADCSITATSFREDVHTVPMPQPL